MPARSREYDPAKEARFVFKGTVKKLKAATMRLEGMPVTDRTAVVRVDEVLQAPEVLSKYAGKDITVQFGGRKKIRAGDQAVFYTNGWLFGDSVAVQSLDHQPVEKALPTLQLHGTDPAKNLTARDLQDRIEGADVVCSGRVTAVRLPDEEETRRPAGEAGPARQLPPSEHDPAWQEAVVDVQEVHKGRYPKKSIIIRFPNSRDVAWAKSPKFRPGQAGVFICRRAEEGEKRRAGQAEVYYTALHPLDFQPADRLDLVRPMLANLARRRRE